MEVIKKAIETQSDDTASRYVIIEGGPNPSDDEWSIETNSEEPTKVYVMHNVKGGYAGEVEIGSVIAQRDDTGKRMDKRELEALFLALYALTSDDIPYDDVRHTIDTVSVNV